MSENEQILRALRAWFKSQDIPPLQALEIMSALIVELARAPVLHEV